jgi:hypothetical protein
MKQDLSALKKEAVASGTALRYSEDRGPTTHFPYLTVTPLFLGSAVLRSAQQKGQWVPGQYGLNAGIPRLKRLGISLR